FPAGHRRRERSPVERYGAECRVWHLLRPHAPAGCEQQADPHARTQAPARPLTRSTGSSLTRRTGASHTKTASGKPGAVFFCPFFWGGKRPCGPGGSRAGEVRGSQRRSAEVREGPGSVREKEEEKAFRRTPPQGPTAGEAPNRHQDTLPELQSITRSITRSMHGALDAPSRRPRLTVLPQAVAARRGRRH